MLKWNAGSEASQIQSNINSFVVKASGSKVIYLLLVLTSFVAMAVAGNKWGG